MADPLTSSSRLGRAGWVATGLASSGVGFVGVIVPGLPTTVFFIIAAWAFSKSSPRLEQWVLGLPRIGPIVSDYRAGLGMRRRAKVAAISTLVLFVTLSVVFGVSSLRARLIIAAAGVIGTAYITWRVPTREVVEAKQDATELHQ